MPRLHSFVVFFDKHNIGPVPSSTDEALKRAQSNLKLFVLNYLVVVAAICLCASLYHPPFAIFILLSLVLCLSVVQFGDYPLHGITLIFSGIASVDVNKPMKGVAAFLVGLLILYSSGSAKILYWTAFLSLIVVGIHAILFNPSLSVHTSQISADIASMKHHVKSAAKEIRKEMKNKLQEWGQVG